MRYSVGTLLYIQAALVYFASSQQADPIGLELDEPDEVTRDEVVDAVAAASVGIKDSWAELKADKDFQDLQMLIEGVITVTYDDWFDEEGYAETFVDKID